MVEEQPQAAGDAIPEVVLPEVEDHAATAALAELLKACLDKNKVDLEYGKWRSANAGKPHTLLEGYDLVSSRLHALAQS